MRVLIVDDDRDHGESIAEVLEMRGYTVEIALSGEDAVACFRDADFDIVLMDVKLPGMNGVEAFAAIRQIRPAARVMMMTGYSVEQLVAKAMDIGAIGVLHKPFAVARLLDVLQKLKPRGRVLVADDDADFVASVEPVLAGAGYAVRVAATGAEAIEEIANAGTDCLVLDLRLPVVSGLEVYARLAKAGQAVPTILVTGGLDHSDAEEVARLQPLTRGLLLKPFDPKALLAAVGAAVSAVPVT